ncbi:unnamed protein product [Rhizophagus irregularis]|nr:unnamed protein product [Rhizophagus irregularis]
MAAPEGGPNAIPYITSTSCLFIRRNLQYIQFKVALPKLEINVKFVQDFEAICKPIEHGADIVHGIGGHGTTIKVNLLGTFGYNSFTI